MARVTTKNGTTFECGKGQSIIDAALESGIVLEHSCISGRCDSCRARVLTGETELIQVEQVLGASDIADKHILMCCRTAKTDLVLDVEGLTDFTHYGVKVLPCKIDALTPLAKDVLEIRFRFPPSAVLEFNAGQYVDLRSPSGVVRSYSIANQGLEDALILQVKNYDDGQMSKYLFDSAKVGDLLSIRGPLGTFHLRNTHSKHVVFLATGTGIAPILSILSFSSALLESQKVWVYWGARFLEDLYFQVGDLEHVHVFRPVLSRERSPACETGYVQDALVKDFKSFEQVVVYACGSSAMINDAFRLLTSRGLPPENFFSDAFVESHREEKL